MLTVEKERHTVEVTATVDGLILRGEESSPDMYASIDLVSDKLEKQIDRYKTRISRRLRSNGFKNGAAIPASTEEDEGPRIVRSKRFLMKPMPIEEAVLQMNLLNHDFFAFLNAETERFAVVYKRKDGHYGLIEPEN
jgi:putative sigma-54 modulation protein